MKPKWKVERIHLVLRSKHYKAKIWNFGDKDWFYEVNKYGLDIDSRIKFGCRKSKEKAIAMAEKEISKLEQSCSP